MKLAFLRLTVVLAVATLLPGCSSTSSAKVSRSGFTSNETLFTQPLDAYLVTSGDDYDYSIHLITAQCMARRGYHIAVANPANFQGAALSISVTLSVARAARYGYHIGPIRGGVSDTDPSNLAPSENTALTACAQRAQTQIGLDVALENDVEALAFTADDAVDADSRVTAAARRWRTCMLPLGVSDLPSEPVINAMPTQSQHRRFWSSSPEYVPTDPEEIRQAVFDAKCRQSSNWDTIYYQATVDYQFTLMDQHADLLAKALDQKNRVDDRVRAALRNLGG